MGFDSLRKLFKLSFNFSVYKYISCRKENGKKVCTSSDEQYQQKNISGRCHLCVQAENKKGTEAYPSIRKNINKNISEIDDRNPDRLFL